jgi:hypothetical protein
VKRRDQFGRELVAQNQATRQEVAVDGLDRPRPVLVRSAVVPDREREPPHVDPQRLADHVQSGGRADDLSRHH